LVFDQLAVCCVVFETGRRMLLCCVSCRGPTAGSYCFTCSCLCFSRPSCSLLGLLAVGSVAARCFFVWIVDRLATDCSCLNLVKGDVVEWTNKPVLGRVWLIRPITTDKEGDPLPSNMSFHSTHIGDFLWRRHVAFPSKISKIWELTGASSKWYQSIDFPSRMCQQGFFLNFQSDAIF
jgi:hypothetical protein